MHAERKGGLATFIGFVVAGVLAGVLWALLADPVRYTVVRVGDESGLTADGVAASAAFGVVVTYMWVGAVVAALWAAFATWRWGLRGSHVLIRTAVGAVVGAFVAWGTGVLAGPPEPAVGDRAAGTEVSARLGIDAYGALFVWPIAALLALLAVFWLTLPREQPEQLGEPEPNALPNGDPTSV